MKKFTSLFLVISMIMCNLNTGVVEALSSYVNELKPLASTLTNNDEEKIVDAEKDDKVLEKKTTQVSTNNDVKNTESVGSTNKETVQQPSDNDKAIDSKNKEKQVKKSSDKKILISDNEGNIQEHVILFYDLNSDGFYYYKDSNDIQKLSWNNEKSINNKINLNNILKNNNLNRVDNKSIYDQEVTLIITGTGSGRGIYFDNYENEDVPFNIVFWKMKGTDCSFSFQNIKSMNIIDENIIENPTIDYAALTYSFNYEYLNPSNVYSNIKPLNIYNNSSFIAYNKDKSTINNNIVCIENPMDYPEDDNETTGDSFKESGDSSIVNISFEDDNEQGKILELKNIGNETSKQIPTKSGYNVVSILLVSDGNSYVLKEKGKATPYYYRTSDNNDENSENLGAVKTRITLDKNSDHYCYEISNKTRVEVIYTEDYQQKYYLTDYLKHAIDDCTNINANSIDFVFLGDYVISEEDIGAIKNYNEDNKKVTFKSKVDDWAYLLNIDYDIELSYNNENKSPITFDNIRFNYTSDDKCIYANGRSLTFGNDVKMESPNYPSVLLGGKESDFNSKNNSYLIINSGTYDYVVGQYNGTLQNMNLIINGGTFNNDVIADDGKVINDVNFTINNNNTLMFKSRVIGAGSESDIGRSLNVSINGGTFSSEVIASNGKVAGKTTLNIADNPIFRSRVIGSSSGSDIGESLNISIKNGTFNNKVIGVDGGTVKNIKLTISNGIFNNNIIGVSLNDDIGKFTLNGLLNRYLFSDNTRVINNKVGRDSSKVTKVNIDIDITGGRFNNNSNLIGSIGNPYGNSTINIEGNITIPSISEFTKLVVGEKKSGTLTVNKLDRGSSTGDLYLKRGNKISFKTGKETSKLNNIELYGNNVLKLPKDITSNTTENKVLIELSGEVKSNGNGKLNIEFANPNIKSTAGMYLIKFENKLNSDIKDKYKVPKGYYLRDISQEKEDSPGYVVLYPQIDFDLEYNLKENKLYMIHENTDRKEEVWWCTKDDFNTTEVTLDTSKLYQYKGYDLLPNNKERKLILTGETSDKNIIVNNKLSNFNVELKNINLTDSNIKLNYLNSLIINGKNIINSIDKNETIFNYTFNDIANGNKVLFKDTNSYLNIFAKKDTNPFNESQEDSIDFKFFKPFEEKTIVRLDNNIEYKFEMPVGTQRLGVLVDGSYNDKTYKLYHNESGKTGNSVYVAGRTDETFTDEFKISKSYEDVRRANPVNKINVDMPSQIYFSIDVDGKKINSPKEINWQNHFHVTEMKVKNNSSVIQDQFIDENKQVHEFFGKGKINPDLELGYMGVSSSGNMNNYITLVSKEKLDPYVETDNALGLKLALKLGNTKKDEFVELDEFIGVSKDPLIKWNISYDKEEIIDIKPNFGDNNIFFNINKDTINTFKLNSSHKFTFRFGLKNS